MIQIPVVISAGALRYRTFTEQMRETLEQLVRMASHDVTLLLAGETGTGKTTLARIVHELSSRRAEPFLKVSCRSIPAESLDRELFGDVRESQQDSGARPGKLDVAGKGTLLLSEIDALPPSMQTKLLSLIETGKFEPVGSSELSPSKARLIVSTNADLRSLMESAAFRPDLYYRLSVLEFHIPPLRERIHDIEPLTMEFVAEFELTHGIRVDRVHPEFLAILKHYAWPGNVRELKNHVCRAVLSCRNGELTPEDLAPALHDSKRHTASAPANHRVAASLFEQVASTEQEILEEALRAHGFKRTATARTLGISRVGLYKKMKKYGLLNLPRNTGRRNGHDSAEIC